MPCLSSNEERRHTYCSSHSSSLYPQNTAGRWSDREKIYLTQTVPCKFREDQKPQSNFLSMRLYLSHWPNTCIPLPFYDLWLKPRKWRIFQLIRVMFWNAMNARKHPHTFTHFQFSSQRSPWLRRDLNDASDHYRKLQSKENQDWIFLFVQMILHIVQWRWYSHEPLLSLSFLSLNPPIRVQN